MNRAQRRLAPKSSAHQSWVDGVSALQRDSSGALNVFYISPSDLPRLLIDAAAGDSEATALLRAALDTVRHIDIAPAKLPALCGHCDNEIRRTAFLVVVASPLGRPLSGSRALCLALCTECQANVKENALRSVRRIWPEARSIVITHPDQGAVH